MTRPPMVTTAFALPSSRLAALLRTDSMLSVALRPHRERPRKRRAAEQRDEIAVFHHSITSSARVRNDSEIANPSVFAALRFTISSNLVGN